MRQLAPERIRHLYILCLLGSCCAVVGGVGLAFGGYLVATESSEAALFFWAAAVLCLPSAAALVMAAVMLRRSSPL
jgi:hypothetical protein